MIPHVYILTWCHDIDALYGSLLSFKTLRVGFPLAPITVVDNASLPVARAAIREAALGTDCRHYQLEQEVPHHWFLERVLGGGGTRPIVFLDPDLCFWEKCEDWHFDSLLAGRRIPSFRDEYTQTWTRARLHTSFLWIPHPSRLKERVLAEQKTRWEWNPVAPSVFYLDGEWQRFDTGAGLYSRIEEETTAFAEKELNAYDHLFVGSHAKRLLPLLSPGSRAELEGMHAAARAGDFHSLRGIWRAQERHFAERAP